MFKHRFLLPPVLSNSGPVKQGPPKDLSRNQVDSVFLLMTQLIERTVQKLWVLGKTASVLKDSFRIQNSLDELKKHP